MEIPAEEKECSEEVRKQSRSTHIRVWKDDHNKLMTIRSGTGFKNLAWVVHMLLEEQAKNLATYGSVMSGNVPVVLTGKPLSGKTYFVKQTLLPSLKDNPVLLIDAWNEYTSIKNIGYEIYGLNFKKFNDHIRFVPNTQSRIAETEVESIFAHLDMKRNELSRWVVIVEESNAFKNVPSFLKFLYGSRHIVRKMVVITPQTDAFEGLVTLTVCNPPSPNFVAGDQLTRLVNGI